MPPGVKNTIIINIMCYYYIRDGKRYNEIELTKINCTYTIKKLKIIHRAGKACELDFPWEWKK